MGNINTGQSSADFAGGITCTYNGNPIIYKNIINNNYGYKGGGIYCNSPSQVIRDNIIIGNSSENGGGIYCDGASPVIEYNTISSDSANSNGGGIYCANNSNPEIKYNLICDNQAATLAGGGIYSTTSQPLIENNTICGNYAFFQGSAMYAENLNPTINNNIFANNTSSIGAAVVTGAALNYCAFHNNTGGHFSGTPGGTGVIDTVNFSGDSCDVYFNIFMDPIFADTANNDYQLTWDNWPISDSTKSPCIDAGDSDSPLDPDSTIADIGAFYFHQLQTTESDTLLDFGIVDIGQSIDLPLTIRNDGTATLHLHNISNQHSVYTHNWDPADSLILPNDSLIITVTFTPVDDNLIVDTLVVENNNEPIQVQLSGTGNVVIRIEDKSDLPKKYALHPAYPNPFNPTTTIKFDLPISSFVNLKVYNILGAEVASLIDKQMNSGTHRYIWNANDLASGLYFYRLNTGKYSKVRKIILLR